MLDNHSICRSLLKDIMKEVRKHVPPKQIKEARGYRYNNHLNHAEFHGPNKFYWHGQACCIYYVRYKGWCAYLRYIGKEN